MNSYVQVDEERYYLSPQKKLSPNIAHIKKKVQTLKQVTQQQQKEGEAQNLLTANQNEKTEKKI